jgi:hypothetical protein
VVVGVLGVYVARKQGHAEEMAEIKLVGPQFFKYVGIPDVDVAGTDVARKELQYI